MTDTKPQRALVSYALRCEAARAGGGRWVASSAAINAALGAYYPTTPAHVELNKAELGSRMRAAIDAAQAADKVDSSVAGRCPACGGSSLFLGDGGYLTCRRMECPNPTAASDILADGEIAHVVTFTPTDFTIRHPLVERLGDALATCELHAYCAALDGPPTLPGRYRVVPRRTGGWSWATLPPKPGESL